VASLTDQIKEMIGSYGGPGWGLPAGNTGGGPLHDLTFILPVARSAVTFALPLDKKLIAPFWLRRIVWATRETTSRRISWPRGLRPYCQTSGTKGISFPGVVSTNRTG